MCHTRQPLDFIQRVLRTTRGKTADDEKGPGLRLKHKVRGKGVKRAGMMRGKSA